MRREGEREREMAREELSRTSSSFSRTSVSCTSTSDLPQLNLDFSPTSVVPRLQSYHSLLLASCSSLCLFVLLACLFQRSTLCPRHHQPRVNGAPAILHQPRVNLVPPPSFNTSRHVRREEGSREEAREGRRRAGDRGRAARGWQSCGAGGPKRARAATRSERADQGACAAAIRPAGNGVRGRGTSRQTSQERRVRAGSCSPKQLQKVTIKQHTNKNNAFLRKQAGRTEGPSQSAVRVGSLYLAGAKGSVLGLYYHHSAQPTPDVTSSYRTV